MTPSFSLLDKKRERISPLPELIQFSVKNLTDEKAEVLIHQEAQFFLR